MSSTNWNIQSLKHSTFLRERWLNSEDMLSEHRVYSKRMVSKQNLVSAFEWGENAENKQRKHDNKVNRICTVIDMWMLCDGKKINFFGVPRSYPHIVYTCTMCIVSAWWAHDEHMINGKEECFRDCITLVPVLSPKLETVTLYVYVRWITFEVTVLIFLCFFCFFQLNIRQQACV